MLDAVGELDRLDGTFAPGAHRGRRLSGHRRSAAISTPAASRSRGGRVAVVVGGEHDGPLPGFDGIEVDRAAGQRSTA